MTDIDMNTLLGGNKLPTDVLNKLLEPEHIEMKTRLSDRQSRTLFKVVWLSELRKPENKDKTELEVLQICIQYYLKIVVSIDGQRTNDITSTLKEMNPKLEDDTLVNNLKKK